MQKIDLPSWNRKILFDKFSQFNSPFFNICADVDITRLAAYVKKENLSFFQASYFLVLKTINSIENFRLRIRDGEVIKHDVIDGSCPILREDGETFNYCILRYFPNFKKFSENAAPIIQNARHATTINPGSLRDDIIHSSIIPWVSFNSFEHAKKIGSGDTCPKVVMGKYFEENGKLKMPLSVSGHHALMDGVHVGLYFKKIQDFLDAPEECL
ncbi:MAG: chloramphenicol acetyltransferase [Saprospiraceae bacterium]